MKPVVVILSAGASERLGQCKALVDLGGRTGLARLIHQASIASAAEIVVVAGAHRTEIALELARSGDDRRARLLENMDWAQGRSGSVALAARAFPSRALLIAPVDVPLVHSEVFSSLFQAWAEARDPPRGWLAPCLDPGPRYGHPLVLGRDLAREISAWDPGRPLREARALARPVLAVPVLDPAILDDLDTPSDLARLRRRLEAED